MDGVLQSYTILKKGLFQKQKLCAVTDRTGQKEGTAEPVHPPGAAQRLVLIGKQAENSGAAAGHPAAQRAVFEDAFPQYLHLGEGYGQIGRASCRERV